VFSSSAAPEWNKVAYPKATSRLVSSKANPLTPALLFSLDDTQELGASLPQKVDSVSGNNTCRAQHQSNPNTFVFHSFALFDTPQVIDVWICILCFNSGKTYLLAIDAIRLAIL
jgi:hypothetical protein